MAVVKYKRAEHNVIDVLDHTCRLSVLILSGSPRDPREVKIAFIIARKEIM